jgi:adenosylmethionine-8-amino-7-oxononanoate aminotransferase
MQANIVRVNHSHWNLKSVSKIIRKCNQFWSHFALEIKTESTATYYGTLRNKLYDFFIENG